MRPIFILAVNSVLVYNNYKPTFYGIKKQASSSHSKWEKHLISAIFFVFTELQCPAMNAPDQHLKEHYHSQGVT